MTINQKPLSITGTRTYDATTSTLPTDLTIGGIVGGETLSLTGQGTIVDKNVGTGKTITLNTLTLNDGSNPTHLASNYTFTGGTHTFDVTQRAITFSGTKVYDGNTTVSSSELTTITNLADFLVGLMVKLCLLLDQVQFHPQMFKQVSQLQMEH